MTFEDCKKRKLDRKVGLKIMNFLGMVKWKPCNYNGARQYLRRLHPLTWVWFSVVVVGGILMYGYFEVKSEVGSMIKDDTVWW